MSSRSKLALALLLTLVILIVVGALIFPWIVKLGVLLTNLIMSAPQWYGAYMSWVIGI